MQSHQPPGIRSLWKGEARHMASLEWGRRGGHEDALNGGRARGQDQTAPRGGHHGTVQAPQHCADSWSRCTGQSRKACSINTL